MTKKDWIDAGADLLFMFVCMVCGAALFYAFMPREPSPPSLVGYGCAMTNGPIYANAEDHFPPCLSIERNIF